MPNKMKKMIKKARRLEVRAGFIGPKRRPKAAFIGPKNKKKKNGKKKKFKGQIGPLNRNGTWAQTIVSDGLNSGLVTTNTSAIVDHFPRRREKVGNVVIPSGYAGGFFQVGDGNGYFINPGNNALFPIFSTIANAYEEYEIIFVDFVFETQEYVGVGTGAYGAGKIVQATNYNVDAPVFTDSTTMENYQGSVRGPPYTRQMRHRVDVKRAKGLNPTKVFYVNVSNNTIAPAGDSQSKFYDIGRYQIALDALPTDMAVGTQVGELFVEYSFNMIRPREPNADFLDQNSSVSHYVDYGETAPNTGTASTANPFGTAAMVAEATSGDAPVIATGGNAVIITDPGRYIVDATWASPTTLTALPTTSHGSAIVPVAEFDYDAGAVYSTFTSSIATLQVIFDVLTAGTTLANAVFAAGPTGLVGGIVDLIISRVASNFSIVDARLGRHRLPKFKGKFRYDADQKRNVAYVVAKTMTPSVQSKLSELERQMSILLAERKSQLDREYEMCNSGKRPLVPPRTLEAARIEAYESKSQSSNSKRV